MLQLPTPKGRSRWTPACWKVRQSALWLRDVQLRAKQMSLGIMARALTKARTDNFRSYRKRKTKGQLLGLQKHQKHNEETYRGPVLPRLKRMP